MTQSNEDLAKTYGPPAAFSEHQKGDHITYTSAEGLPSSGTIIWVQAASDTIPLKYVVAPDEPGSFLDFVLPGDVIASTQGEPP